MSYRFLRHPGQLLIPILLMFSLHGCISVDSDSGSSNTGSSDDDTSSDDSTDDNSGSDSSSSSYILSGTISAANGIVVDSDTNDIEAEYSTNDSIADAQEVANLVTIQGFVNATPTRGIVSGVPSLERFADSADRNDYYYAWLQGGQVISLQVVNYQRSYGGYQGDIDLQLIDASGDIQGYSNGSGEFESITVPEDGQYYIRVYANSGSSKYVMSLAAAGDTLTSNRSSSQSSDFATGEMLLKTTDSSAQSARSAARSSLQALGISDIRASQADRDGHNRIRFDLPDNSSKLTTTVLHGVDVSAGNYEEKFQTLLAIKQAAAEDGVEFAEPNYIYRKSTTTPDDSRYDEQWGLRMIDLPAAWDITTGARSDGNDVVVAVVDTGVFLSHSDLADQLTSDGYDFISDSSNSNDGDGIDNDPDDPGDNTTAGLSSWHGTHVAGIIAAASNNSKGVAGISWNAKIMPVRVLGIDGGTVWDIIQGMYYAAGLDNDSGLLPDQAAAIINLSLGGDSASTIFQNAIDDINAAGVIIVAASGNSGNSTTLYPAGYDHVIAVGATNAEDELTSYSNYGSKQDLVAPGGASLEDVQNDGYPDGILSTVANDSSGSRVSSYAYYQGTSMAAPHVSGVLALMKAVYPELTPTQVDALIANGDISDDLGSSGRDNYYGYGRINALKAVNAALSLANDGEVTLPVILTTDVDILALGSSDSADFTLSNEGGGNPVISSVSGTDSWLSVTASDVDSDGFGSYTVSVDRTDLNDGYYRDTITATDDNGNTTTMTVTMIVGELNTIGQLTTQYVLVYSSSGSLVDETSTNSDGEYSLELEPGSYEIYAGSDIDVDFRLCTDGETCGAWPSLNNPEAVTISSADVSDVDFTVSLMSSTDSSSSSLNSSSDESDSSLPDTLTRTAPESAASDTTPTRSLQ
ncbi:S8 family serine peptidase [Oceanobacter mangrovi]|uniref:S8 family serine peptidase n=1 Tax=Oceanobacter mangrovi TaxID=2862510 RepID=UPI001C8E236A|nr:S8 family serine peptidase [Oceanobacter mangrovi]